jgi:uncharacterized protein YbaR (Trm112 family)
MINLSAGCKYHSCQSIVNMKLEEFQLPGLYFASNATSFMAYCSINFLAMVTMLPLELLQIIACPICKGELVQIDEGPTTLHCQSCNRDYPVVEGIPMLLP